MTKLSFHYRDDGARDALPVVFLHAFPMHSGMWDAQHVALAEYARCVSFDVAGLGRSAPPLTPNMLEHLVDDLFTLIDHLQLKRVVLCGLSMGGYVALRAMERDPAAFSGLFLANTQAGADGNEAKLKRAEGISKLRKEGAVAYVDNFLKVAFSATTQEREPTVIASARRIMLDSSIDGMAHGLVALATRTDTTESLAAIKVPTRVVAGEDDAIVKPDVMRAMADKIDNADFQVLPKVGHLSNLEAPDAFNQWLIELVTRIASGA